jgi:hypothetical protein
MKTTAKQQFNALQEQDRKKQANAIGWVILGLVAIGIYALTQTVFSNHLTY